MELMPVILFFLLFVLILLSIFGGILYLISKIPKVGLPLSFLTGLYFLYAFYISIFPAESFYTKEFTYNTKIALPESITFIQKDASYPDLHGDYYATAIMQIKENDFKNLRKKMDFMKKIKIARCYTPNTITEKFGDKLTPLECWEIKKSDDERFQFIMFSDMKTIYFLYNQT